MLRRQTCIALLHYSTQQETICNGQVGLAGYCCTGVARGHGCPFQGKPWEELSRFRMDGSRGTATPITRFEHPSINPSGIARRPPVMMQEHVWSWWPVIGLLVDHLPKFWCRDLCVPRLVARPQHNTLMRLMRLQLASSVSDEWPVYDCWMIDGW